MRISWLSAAEIAVARQALTGGPLGGPALSTDGASWDAHFAPDFVVPPLPEGTGVLDWDRITEHVARAERVSAVVREHGFEAALARFGTSEIAIEAATIAAAAHEGELLDLDRIIAVLRCEIDPYVFYAHFLELLIGRAGADTARAVVAYEAFASAYAVALEGRQHGKERVGAVRDGLADVYVSVGMLDEATALFEMRHEEDQRDVAVALTASRAFLAAGKISHAVRWLGVGAMRATMLGREDMAKRLRAKQDAVRKRLS